MASDVRPDSDSAAQITYWVITSKVKTYARFSGPSYLTGPSFEAEIGLNHEPDPRSYRNQKNIKGLLP